MQISEQPLAGAAPRVDKHRSTRAVPFTAEWVTKRSPDFQSLSVFDGHPVIASIQRAYHKAARPYLLQFHVNGRLMLEADGFTVEAARKAWWEEIQRQARGRCSDVKAMVNAIQGELKWSHDEALAVAWCFIFPTLLILEHCRLYQRRSGTRGRPPVVDALTLKIHNMILGWEELTHQKVSTAKGAWFARAVEAAAPFLELPRRRGQESISQIRIFLKAEIRKLSSGKIEWIRPPSGWFATSR